MSLHPRILIATLVLVLLAGCSTMGGTQGDALDVELSSRPATTSAPAPAKAPGADEQPINIKREDKAHAPAAAKVEIGNGELINQAAARAPLRKVEVGEGQITFSFENTPIQAVVQNVLGSLLQENYTISPNVTGNVTFSTAKPITAAQALPILEMLLGWTNNTLVRKEGRYEVVPIKDAIPGNLTPRIAPPNMAQGYEVRVFPLKYISATEMQKLLKPYAKAEAIVSADNQRSMIVMAGTAAELENYARTIDVFDVDWLKGMSVGVYSLRNMDVTKVMPELDKIFGATGESPLAGMFRFVPMETTNSIIVITSQRDYLTTAEQWLYRLDMGVGENGTQLYVYDVKNAKANELSDHLNAIFTGRTSGASSSSGNVAPGLRPVTIGALGGSGAGGIGGTGGIGGSMAGSRLGSTTGGTYGQGRSGTTGALTGGAAGGANVSTTGAGAGAGGAGGGKESDIRITPIEENNQLLVMATPGEWDSILAAIRRLDIPQLQVQLEVKILEITLTGNLQFGLQWYLAGLVGSATGSAQANGQYQPPFGPNTYDRHRAELGATGNTGPTSNGGFFYSFLNKDFEVAINALQQDGQARTLSAPSLVVMNNQEAQINVGTQIPVVQTYYNGFTTGTPVTTPGGTTGNPLGTSAYGGTTGSVQYLNTGVVLDVRPRVNPGGLVYLEVQQEVSNPEAAPAGTNPPIDQRQLSTQVAVQSGRTVLLGGLIRDIGTISNTGLPWISNIPVLGRLFGNTSHTTNRTELIVLITPQVINNADDADRVTAEYQSRFRALAPLQPVRAKYYESELPKPSPQQPAPEQPAPAEPEKSQKD
ncbi:MAG TPA: type II secretion system secretin GspD [Rudaea sp.]|nr:type II secretion system secretin GspD [Rudaea sp.]